MEQKDIKDIILKYLNLRDKFESSFWLESSPEDKHTPRYVMEMIKELSFHLYIPIEDIKRVELTASEHIDYIDKFTLYCWELYKNKK